MSGILSGKRGLLFGALDERSLAWHIAQRCMAEGAQIVQTNTETAIQLGTIGELAREHNVPLIACDATKPEEIAVLLKQTQELLGGKIDFVLHAVAQSMNLRRHKTYEHANYAYYQQTLDISAISLHKLLRTALEQWYLNNDPENTGRQYVRRIRTALGLVWRLNKRNSLDFYYRFNYGYDRDVNVKPNKQTIHLSEDVLYQHALGICYHFDW